MHQNPGRLAPTGFAALISPGWNEPSVTRKKVVVPASREVQPRVMPNITASHLPQPEKQKAAPVAQRGFCRL
jgi:hypothetical protein